MVKEEKMEVDLGSKRKNQDGNKMNIKKKPYDISGKTPSQALHELFLGTELNFQQLDEKSPLFKVNAVVEGKGFEGIGPSKNHAKRDLAMKALHQLKGFALLTPETSVYPVTTQVALDQKVPLIGISNKGNESAAIISSGLINNLPTIDVEKIRSGPSMMLTQVFREAELNFTEGGRGDKHFRVETEIMNRNFFGEGRSKKMAKLNLAKTVFLVLYNINDFKTEEVLDEAPSNESLGVKKSKFPMTQLKDLVGGDLKVEMERFEEDNGEKKFHCTITVKGRAYEAIGDNKDVARIHAAKKALEVFKPKTNQFVNTYGVDVGSHPSVEFQKHFPGVEISESESKAEEGFTEYHFEIIVNRKSFKLSARSKKKGKLRLMLQVFEAVKKTAPTEWRNIDLNKIYEDKPINAVAI